jgi:hypothetical protein
MKKIMYVMIVLFMLSPLAAWAETFLGAPLPEGGTVISQTDKKVITTYAMPYADVIAFYKEQFKKLDCKFKNRDNSTFIEEYTALPWHSVWIEKTAEGTRITVTKDSWMWILGTLTLRFFAVFIVLIGLFIPLSIIGWLVKRAQDKAAAAQA